MAAASAASQIFGGDDNCNSNSEVNRKEIQAAISKAVELRALHAALKQGNSPEKLRYPTSSSPVSHPVSQFCGQDYPVFTPTYEDEAMSGYQSNNKALSKCWEEYGMEAGNETETVLSDYKREISASRKGFSPALAAFESHICPADEDQKSVTGSCANHINVLQTSPGKTFYKSSRSRRNSLGDFKLVSSCNRCNESENVIRNINSNIVVPLTDSHSSSVQQSQPKNRGVISRLFPRLKKKLIKNDQNLPNNRTDSEEVSQIFKDFSMLSSIETLKREVIQANKNRDEALNEVSEMRSSLGELKDKMEYLETYCEELKKALRQASISSTNGMNLRRRGKSIDGNVENLMPVSEEVMVEGLLQIVSEARLSVRQFCKTLIGQIEETDNTLMENLNSLLQPHKLSLNSKYSKPVLYHLEAVINQSMYQDFENCVFQNNGSPKLLDPQQDRQAQFSSFVALRNLSWNEVLRKGTKCYSEEFSKFCDQKMSLIISTLKWTRAWPEQLLQAFFVAAKCIWLLHLLAFSFNPAVGILRIEENRNFDSNYMEDVFVEKQSRSHGGSRVKIMVMPGFYVQGRVLRCKVICRYKTVS